MKCPNCTVPFVEEKAPKYLCSTCGWLELIGREWKNCGAPESPPPQESPPPPESPPPQESTPEPKPKPSPPSEPSPATLEPNPRALEPGPKPKVKSLLWGLITVTETEAEK